MEFSDLSIAVRQISNGSMTLLAVVLFVVFTEYILFDREGGSPRWRFDEPGWWQDKSVQAAFGLVFLLAGHFIRAGLAWMEFLWLDLGWDPRIWTEAWVSFIILAALILTGKVLMLWTFTFYEKRAYLVPAAVALSLLIPLGIWVWANWS